MLVLLEKYIAQVRAARTDADVGAVLGTIAQGFGFRSGILLQLRDQTSLERAIDSWPERSVALMQMVAEKGSARGVQQLRRILDQGSVARLGPDRITDDHPYGPFFRSFDMVHLTAVPVTLGPGELGGVVLYCGRVELTDDDRLALQSLSYALFVQVRALQHVSTPPDGPRLTARELEVMRLAAAGKSSLEIGEALGIAMRTVNHYFDSVGDKLGTHKRAQAIAELLRRGVI